MTTAVAVAKVSQAVPGKKIASVLLHIADVVVANAVDITLINTTVTFFFECAIFVPHGMIVACGVVQVVVYSAVVVTLLTLATGL